MGNLKMQKIEQNRILEKVKKWKMQEILKSMKSKKVGNQKKQGKKSEI